VRSALLDVQGVKSAKVTLEEHEAVVTYNPRDVSVQDLINAINRTAGPLVSIQYSAAIKPSQR
jgi:copper chaperone CopZ